MKKALAKSMLVIVGAGIDEIADRLKKRRTRNEHPDELAHVHGGCGAYDLHNRSTAHSSDVGHRRAMRKRNARRRSISKG